MQKDDLVTQVPPGSAALWEAGISWEQGTGQRGTGAIPEHDSKGPGPPQGQYLDSLTATFPGGQE